MFSTKLTIKLTNCSNQQVFISDEGISKMKDYKKAYHEALRKAFESVKEQDYVFNSKESIMEVPFKVVENSQPVQKVEVVEEHTLDDAEELTEAAIEIVQENKNEVEKVQQEIEIEKSTEGDSYQLYAQKTPDGFQLVDDTPKIVYKLLQTSIEDHYILEGISGIAYKKAENWYAEYYFEGRLVKKELHVKF